MDSSRGTFLWKGDTGSMRINGHWHLWDDGVIRPVIRGEAQGIDLCSGADKAGVGNREVRQVVERGEGGVCNQPRICRELGNSNCAQTKWVVGLREVGDGTRCWGI